MLPASADGARCTGWIPALIANDKAGVIWVIRIGFHGRCQSKTSLPQIGRRLLKAIEFNGSDDNGNQRVSINSVGHDSRDSTAFEGASSSAVSLLGVSRITGDS
jgi:hypothetical protein